MDRNYRIRVVLVIVVSSITGQSAIVESPADNKCHARV
jgi:hypothetical protein